MIKWQGSREFGWEKDRAEGRPKETKHCALFALSKLEF